MAHSIVTIDPTEDRQTSRGLFHYLSTLSPSSFSHMDYDMVIDDMVIDDSNHDNSMMIDMPMVLQQIYTIILDAFTKAIQAHLGIDQIKYPLPWNLVTVFDKFNDKVSMLINELNSIILLF